MHDTSVSPEKLWREFAHEHATVAVLARRHHRSEKWIRMRLDAHEPLACAPEPRALIAVADATWIHGSWMLVVRDPHRKENVYHREIQSEGTSDYQRARAELEGRGFTFLALVGDGRLALPWAFSGIPFQMCHFHMEQIVIRYTTRQPKLPAAIELLELVRTLPRTDSASFMDAFDLWCRARDAFLCEKSIHPETGRRAYTHRRLRSARDSIRRHLPHLFTFEKCPELNIPNTTNSLDGFFKRIKLSIGLHAGLTHTRKLKLITSLLYPPA